MNKISMSANDLSALFDIDIAEGGADFDAESVKRAMCPKCHGRGNFVGYSGSVKCFACDGSGLSKQVGQGGQAAPDGSSEIDVAKIATAFATARSRGIKTPKLRLDTFLFSRAPDTGKNPGAIYVKDGETYLGKVLGAKFFPSRDCTADHKTRVIAIAADPAGSAKAFGLRTGSCSVCGRTLTNGVSIDLGIGPICAERFGW